MNNFTLNLYKAFGLRKQRLQMPYGVQGFFLSDGVFGNTELRGFRTAKQAMKYAIEHTRQGDSSHYAFIHHPNNGQNKLSHASNTGNLTLSHVSHGSDENVLMRTDDPWKVGDLAGRDTLALKRMQHLHNSAASSLGDTPMDIDSGGLYDLPDELHTTQEAQKLAGEVKQILTQMTNPTTPPTE